MDISLSNQAAQALLSLALGGIIGFLYDFLRVVRRRLKAGAVTMLSDLLFWIIAAICAFVLGMSVGGGRTRLFMMLFIAIGAALYFYSLSAAAVRLCEALADFLRFLVFCFTRPFVWTALFLKKITGIIKNLFKYGAKWYKISYNGFYTLRQEEANERFVEGGDFSENWQGKYYYEAGRPYPDRIRYGDSYKFKGAGRKGKQKRSRFKSSG